MTPTSPEDKTAALRKFVRTLWQILFGWIAIAGVCLLLHQTPYAIAAAVMAAFDLTLLGIFSRRLRNDEEANPWSP